MHAGEAGTATTTEREWNIHAFIHMFASLACVLGSIPVFLSLKPSNSDRLVCYLWVRGSIYSYQGVHFFMFVGFILHSRQLNRISYRALHATGEPAFAPLELAMASAMFFVYLFSSVAAAFTVYGELMPDGSCYMSVAPAITAALLCIILGLSVCSLLLFFRVCGKSDDANRPARLRATERRGAFFCFLACAPSVAYTLVLFLLSLQEDASEELKQQSIVLSLTNSAVCCLVLQLSMAPFCGAKYTDSATILAALPLSDDDTPDPQHAVQQAIPVDQI